MRCLTRQTFIFLRTNEQGDTVERFLLKLTTTPTPVPDWCKADPTFKSGFAAGLIDVFDDDGPRRIG